MSKTLNETCADCNKRLTIYRELVSTSFYTIIMVNRFSEANSSSILIDTLTVDAELDLVLSFGDDQDDEECKQLQALLFLQMFDESGSSEDE